MTEQRGMRVLRWAWFVLALVSLLVLARMARYVPAGDCSGPDNASVQTARRAAGLTLAADVRPCGLALVGESRRSHAAARPRAGRAAGDRSGLGYRRGRREVTRGENLRDPVAAAEHHEPLLPPVTQHDAEPVPHEAQPASRLDRHDLGKRVRLLVHLDVEAVRLENEPRAREEQLAPNGFDALEVTGTALLQDRFRDMTARDHPTPRGHHRIHNALDV
jgi:hypothetical protein